MDRVNVDLSDYSDSTLFNLIEEVQKNEFLYDVPPSSRNNPELANKREKTWNEIAWIFGLPAVEVRSIWVKLRSGFARYFKIYQASKNTDKPFNPNNWKFFDSLLFLIPFLKLSPASVAVAKSSAQMASQTAAKRAVKRSKNFLLHQGSTSQDKGDCRIQESKNLIEAVKSKPQLWGLLSNPRSLTREENIVRDAAFEEIALELGGNVKLLKKNWYRLYYGYCKGKLSLDGELYSMMSVFDKADISTMSNGGPEPDDSPSDDSMQVTQKPYQQSFMNSNGSKPSSSQTKSLSVSPSPSRQNKHIPAIPSTTMKREATSISSETYRHNGASLFPSHLVGNLSTINHYIWCHSKHTNLLHP